MTSDLYRKRSQKLRGAECQSVSSLAAVFGFLPLKLNSAIRPFGRVYLTFPPSALLQIINIFHTSSPDTPLKPEINKILAISMFSPESNKFTNCFFCFPLIVNFFLSCSQTNRLSFPQGLLMVLKWTVEQLCPTACPIDSFLTWLLIGLLIFWIHFVMIFVNLHIFTARFHFAWGV